MWQLKWLTATFTMLISIAVQQAEDQVTRVKGGQDAEKGAYPWQISLGINRLEGHYHRCGGSIIDKQWVLTAAHCVTPLPTSLADYSIMAGEHDLEHREGTEQQYFVEKIIRHEGYNMSIGNMDVALIKIKGEFRFGVYISSIRLARLDQEDISRPNINTYCVTSGWGDLKLNGGRPNILQAVEMPLLPLKICKDIYSVRHEEYEVTDDMVCSGHLKGDKSPCHGDSGGPLACLVEGKWALAGVVSWGKDCGYPEYPAVYASVVYFHDWITEKMVNN